MKKAVITEVLKPSKEKKTDSRVDLKGEIGRKFLYVKEKLGLLKTDEDVLIHLINEAYQKCLNPRKEKS